jgi:predicted Zn-dependent protease
MTFQRLMPLAAAPLVCIALLSACGTTEPVAGAAARPATVAAAMAEADAAVQAGQHDRAFAILKRAGSSFPTDKTPWVRMAQMHFDGTHYGAAIVDAQEALQRDPDDTLAHSIVAVSGLRVTSRALADISKKNNLTGNVRTEAQDLARLLRTSLNETELVANGRAGRPAVKETIKKAATAISASAPAPRPNASSDPLGILK